MRVDDIFFLNLFAVFAVSINALLIFLIIFKSPKSLGSYKYLMIYIAVFELTYAVMYVLEKPDLFTKESAFFLVVNWKKSFFPRFICVFLDLLFAGFFGISIAILALHFIHRFLSITNDPRIESFSSWKLVLWFAMPLLNGVVFMLTGGIVSGADEETDRFLRENYPPLLENITVQENLYYMGPFFWPKLKNSESEQYFSWKGARGTLIAMSIITLSSSVMIFFGVKAYRSMNRLMKHSGCSKKFRSIQSQLFRALVFQTLIPVFLMHIPASSIYITIFFNCSKEIIGQTLSLTIAMYPALNPLPTIFIVKNYRNALKMAFLDLQSLVCCQTRVHSIQSGMTSTRGSTAPQGNTTRMEPTSRI